MSRDQQLRRKAYEEIELNKDIVEQDPYRLKYHLMPPVGLLNDPNGFIQWDGNYHLFYQWMPFKTGHGAKFWGHYVSKDLVTWKHEEIALTPSEWFEKNGCYSGSAIGHNDELHLFYTGNVKDKEGNRETYQCLAVSGDGVNFDKKGPVIELPVGYTSHFRDPKVWEQDGRYFMVVGAQTSDLKGAVALFASEDLIDWEHLGMLAGGGKPPLNDFGYMFECPDLFSLDETDVLVFSPQGLKPEGMEYQNVYQSGYVIGTFEPVSGVFMHGEFEELDRGFDFYAPQTTEDEQGRRILFAWMSVPDQNEQDHPTIGHKWLHNMTIPRELRLTGGKVVQLPVQELESLRLGEAIEHKVVLNYENVKLKEVSGKAVELLLDNIQVSEGWFSITIGGAARIVYSKKQNLFSLERKSYVDGTVEKRQCYLDDLNSLRIFIDTSSIEVFINNGEETFTARFYPVPDDESIQFESLRNTSFNIKKWNLGNIIGE
ncbi:glycoside hydrolase family 32 protein [Pseudalkalibacillus caeni]|uniref:glycoside hydrolase family 32 protein n=1 Tax=Exobacillus caeni TaxID=2574798 RepID=UPI0014855503|nr:sucrose-6-phosphate hydrolase [Pseudalkalibacillus caeni]